MPKIRIYELAKQIDISSKDIIDRLNSYGRSVNNHMSVLDDADVKRLTNDLKPSAKTTAPAEAKVTPEGRPLRPRPVGPDGQPLPPRPRPEGTAADAEGRPLRRRPVGPDGQPLPPRPRPEGTAVDAEGRPLRRRPLGPDGKPLPPRPRPEGTAVDAEGRPLRRRRPLGPDGKPLPPRPRPEGTAVDAEGRPLRRRRPLGPDGKPLPPRPRPEGTAVDAEGRPLRRRRPLGPDGKPLPPRPRPEGTTVDAEGRPLRRRPLGPDGKPLPPRPRPEGIAMDAEDRPLRRRPLRRRPLRPDGQPLPPRLRPSLENAVDAEGRPLRLRPRPEGTGGAEFIHPAPPRPEESASPRPAAEPAASAPAETPVKPAPAAPAEISAPVASAPPNAPSGSAEQRPPRSDRPRRDGSRPGGKDAASSGKAGGGQRSDSGQRSGPGQGQSRPPQERSRTGSGQDRPGGQGRTGGAARPGSPRPGGFSGAPRGDGSPRPGGSRPGGFSSGAPRGDGAARPGGFKAGERGGFGRPAAARPVLGAKKDDKKTEPTKDDRKQDWKKNEQMRTVKSKDNKDSDKKENKKILDRKDGHGRRGSGKPKEARAAAKRVMPVKIEPVITEITFPPEGTVRDLAEKLHKSNADIIKVLMKKGVMATANQTIDFDTASVIAETFDVIVNEYVEVDVFEQAFAVKPDDDADLRERPPVVVVMGHVDHGKTSLLDAIRNANVTKLEAGGITQHIGAYTVNINGKPITFLDTPGHEAFTAMRMRGAQVTDIAILVVDANDGVMPQTIEAINHAKAANVEIIIAINKIDKPGANPDRVKQELTEFGLLVEDWGGETIAVPVSALQKIGIEQLLEMVIIVSEMKELRANPNRPARGSIIEAKLDKGRGPVATVLVQDGTLRIGDPIVAGACFGKIRAMTDDKGKSVKEAGPSIPVEVIGLSEVPSAGDAFYVAEHEKQARQLSETVIAKGRESLIKATPAKVSLDDLFTQIQAGNVKDLNVVVKADVQGSVEALKTSLDKLSNDQVRVRTIHGGVGAITETDVMLASASNAIIIGFNVRPEPMAKQVADAEKVDVRLYRVIYSALDDITAAMKGMLDPEFQEKILGHAEIRQIFRASGVGTIGGAYVVDGHITRAAKVRIVRDGRVVYDGTLDTLRRFKDDVREVASGYECGMLFNRFNDIKENDRVEAYVMEEIPR